MDGREEGREEEGGVAYFMAPFFQYSLGEDGQQVSFGQTIVKTTCVSRLAEGVNTCAVARAF